MALSIVIPTFKRDFGLLERQLVSFEQHLKSTAPITIVLCDDPNLIPVLEAICGRYTSLDIRVIDHHTLPVDYSDWGWANQQIIKLVFAKICNTTHYLILDSKNFLSSDFDPDSLIIDGRAPMIKGDVGEDDIYFSGSYNLFGLDHHDSVERVTWGITPYIMQTQIVLDMLQYLEERGITLSKIIGRAPGNTHECAEFALYSAWLEKNNLHESFTYFTHSFNNVEANKNRLDDQDHDPLAPRYYR